jgi:uncharacterized protein YggL (DUF469 family)
MPARWASLALASFALLAAGCGSRSGSEVENQVVSESQIDEALDSHRDELLAVSGVQGVGRGECEGRPCIRVFVSDTTQAARERIMSILEGFPVEIVRTGEFQARDTTTPDP